ncbi:MAG: AzlC family ABC transporter permease [Oscillospiraceae bacterium]|nr:AzlC family ABC transporter permease [Oscillospiraceae bacterium]
MKAYTFKEGLRDGIPICLGYLSVAFAFGIFCIQSGLSIIEALLISATNVTSAGQLAGVPIIVGGGTLVEMAMTQLVINLRYALMSVSLSQKFGKDISMLDRIIIAFVNTDEVFAVASGKEHKVSRNYMYGLILLPFLGWTSGTLIGAVAGNIFPSVVIASLGVAIYGMFVAIVVPVAKKDKNVLICVCIAMVMSCLLNFLTQIPSGFVIIICAIVASFIMAYVRPIEEVSE